MKKTNFTTMPFFRWAFFTLLGLSFSHQSALAQAMACNNLVQVSVSPTPNTCSATITADMILEGNPVLGHDYSIVVKQGFTIIASGTNQVTITNASLYFGQTLTATITDLTTGNSCWGQMILEDKLAPVITCTDLTVNCSADLNTVGIPSAVDNCDPTPSIQLTNEVINTAGLCTNGYVTVTRTYIAIDDYGNTSAPCTRIIYVTRPALVDFPSDIVWHCTQYASYANIVNATPLHPSITDSDPSDLDIDVSINTSNSVLQQTGSGIVSNISGLYCNYVASHADAVLQTCGNTFKIIRTWTVLDWCTGAVVTTGIGGEDNVQVIKVVDLFPPTITHAPFNVSANIPGVHPQPCKSTGFLQPATVTDNCNGYTVKIFTPVGEAQYISGGNGNNGGLIPAPGLPVGVHTITYTATDACGNQSSIGVPVTVVDNIAPVAICDEITDVNLSSDGIATVFAATFDDGSHDNCCLDHFSVRRMVDNCADGHDDTVFGPSVVFCCSDLPLSPITVVFRAYDCYGNYNDCMVIAHVNDKIPPVLVSCPQQQRVLCDWYALNLETQLAGLTTPAAQSQYLDQYFGTATFYDNCSYTLNRTININIDQCLEGTITRTWTASDPSNNNGTQSCTQTVFVDHVSDWVVEFPADITVTCTSAVPQFGEPEIFYETCELVAVSHDDVLYNVVPDACYKIVRTWTIINWCVVGANIDQEVAEQPENQLGLPFPQCDLDGDGDCDGRTFRDSWRSGGAPVENVRPTSASATRATVPDTDLDSDPWDGYIVYQQVIKVIDNVDPVFTNGCQIPDVCILDNSCVATVVLPTPEVDDCSPNVTITASSQLGNGFGPFFNVAPGIYNVTYNAQDNCNNQKSCTSTITVRDCKKPTPYCKNGLVIELMVVDPAMVQVWASDFNAGSFDNCPGTLKLSFSANTDDIGRTFDCEDVGQQPIQMWVTDAAGNQDYCETFVIIQANMGQCPGTDPLVNMGGAVANEEDESVEGVSVSLSGQSTANAMTGNDGMYNFTNIPVGNDITVTPALDENPLNGVTTFDLVLISKHILGIEALNTPYKMIAADANKSNAVTTADLVELRKLILQIIPNFSNNTSWRFVDKDYVFPANPFSAKFPEVININNIPSTITSADFVAVKIGDVNGNAVTNIAGINEERTNTGTLVLTADDRRVTVGEEIAVEINASDLEVLGFQFTMNFDRNAIEFVELLPGMAKEENFGFTLLDKGAITASWNGNAANGGSSNLFTLVFRATEAGQLSDLLSLNSRFTSAEAYNRAGETMNVSLNFNGSANTGFEVYQNTPNPFKGQSVIGFNLPEAGSAKVTISDVSGKILSAIEREFSKGYNEVRVNSNDLATGVLYYTVETASETATRKMVIIE